MVVHPFKLVGFLSRSKCRLAVLSLWLLAWILSIPVIILLILVLHESPAWLFERDRVEEGRQAANFYKLDMEQFRTQQEVKSQRETVRQSYLTCPQPTCFQKFKAKMIGITTMDKSFWANFTFLSLLFLLFGKFSVFTYSSILKTCP